MFCGVSHCVVIVVVVVVVDLFAKLQFFFSTVEIHFHHSSPTLIISCHTHVAFDSTQQCQNFRTVRVGEGSHLKR